MLNFWKSRGHYLVGMAVAAVLFVLFGSPANVPVLVDALGSAEPTAVPLWMGATLVLIVVGWLLFEDIVLLRPHQDDRYGRPGGHRPDDRGSPSARSHRTFLTEPGSLTVLPRILIPRISR